jgi:alcohol dehydrogenase YqhD (iron-dependent ADH family)
MKNFTYYQPTRIVFGRGESEKIGGYLASISRRVLMVYGQGSVVKSGLIERVKKSLEAEGIEYVLLGGVQPNPRLTLVRRGIELVREHGIDAILAVGGGSVIDTAKSIGVGVKYDGDVWDFYAGGVVPQETLPVAVVLTIAAAGSECSNSNVITNDTLPSPEKRGINYDVTRPVLAVMDPELTYTLPAYQTAAGGYDIMAHVMERYFTREEGVDFTDRMCEATLKTVIRALPIALSTPDDYDARSQLMWASTIAHNDLLSTGRVGDWASHRMAHQPSALYDITHGAALSIIFPAWMRYVYKSDVNRFAQFAVRVWEVEPDFNDLEKTALAGIERMEDFIRKIGLPLTFTEAGIPYSRFEEMASRATGGDTFKLGMFYPLTMKDILEIYHSAI